MSLVYSNNLAVVTGDVLLQNGQLVGTIWSLNNSGHAEIELGVVGMARSSDGTLNRTFPIEKGREVILDEGMEIITFVEALKRGIRSAANPLEGDPV